ncbi:MAG: YdcF family protein [Cyanobium sp.]
MSDCIVLVGMSGFGTSAHEALTELVFLPDNPVQADYTVVCGMSLWERPVSVACDLYRRGIAGKLIFTGGYNHRIRGTEAEAMTAKALASGIPPGEVFCEDRAAHTRENLEFSWSIMKTAHASVSAINLIGINYHVKRALLTARAVLPHGIRIGHASYPSLYFDRDSWHATERGRRDVLNELSKLQAYFPEAMPQELSGAFS